MNRFLSKPAPSRDGADERVVRSYLEQRPFPGKCEIGHKDAVKAAASNAGGAARWDGETKAWSATNLRALSALLRSGIWTPLGVPFEWVPLLQKRAEAACKAEETAEQGSVDQEQQTNEATRLEAIERAREKRDLQKMRMLDAREDDAEDLAELGEHGVTAEVIKRSAAWPELGPRSGLSNAKRLWRAVRIAQHPILAAVDLAPTERRRRLEATKQDVLRGFAQRRDALPEPAPKKKKAARAAGAVDRGGAEEAPSAEEASLAADAPRPVAVVGPSLATRCAACRSTTIDQFEVCGCEAGQVGWRRCDACGVLRHPTLSACAHMQL